MSVQICVKCSAWAGIAMMNTNKFSLLEVVLGILSLPCKGKDTAHPPNPVRAQRGFCKLQELKRKPNLARDFHVQGGKGDAS